LFYFQNLSYAVFSIIAVNYPLMLLFLINLHSNFDQIVKLYKTDSKRSLVSHVFKDCNRNYSLVSFLINRVVFADWISILYYVHIYGYIILAILVFLVSDWIFYYINNSKIDKCEDYWKIIEYISSFNDSSKVNNVLKYCIFYAQFYWFLKYDVKI
jgi:hypothetical protein